MHESINITFPEVLLLSEFSIDTINAACDAAAPAFLTDPAIMGTFAGAWEGATSAVLTCGEANSFYTMGIVNIKEQDNVSVGGAGAILPNMALLDSTAYHGNTNCPWTRDNLGDLFGLAVADDGTIYAASGGGAYYQAAVGGSIGGGHQGTIYQISNTTGCPSVWTQLTQDDINLASDNTGTGPGLGNIAYDYNSGILYVANLENGLIHQMNAGGTVANTYDHGITGRSAENLPTIADDITNATADYITGSQYLSNPAGNNGATLPGRRIVGLDIGPDGRLYYSIWWRTQSGTAQPTWFSPQNGNQQLNVNNENNEIWSIGLNADGSFDQTDIRREWIQTGVNNTNPIVDIIFAKNALNGAYRMIVSTDGLSLDFQNPAEHSGITIELTGNNATWTADATKYVMGQNGNDAADGLAYDQSGNNCDGRIWASGEALYEGAGTDVIGLQGMNDDGKSYINTTSILVDADGADNQPKGAVGDVEIFCASVVTVSCPTPPCFSITITEN